MRRLPKPNLDVSAVYASCVQGVIDAAAATRFHAAAPNMEHLAGLYDSRAAANGLNQFVASKWGQPGQVVVGALTKDDLTTLYTDYMAKRNVPARPFYDKLLITPLGKCPYCGFGHVSTLDHFLPKARYPEFAVLPTNLVPCCGDCNHGKGAGVLTADNLIPHPYYETPAIEADTWLFARIKETTPACAQYFVVIPASWPAALALRVQNYFRDLELASRFAVEAASEIVSLSDLLVPLENAELVRQRLQQDAGIERARRTNTWKAALYEALAGSAWYCGGGWRVGDWP
jgi:hypothetical protein